MNNSIKHSEATEINLKVNTKENVLSLQYQDNGKGFDMEAMRNARGLGMSGIENRAVISEGTLKIISSPGNGIQVELLIPSKHAN